MKIGQTKFTRLLRSPHFDMRPFRCTLYLTLLQKKDPLRALSQTIKAGKFTPFFEPGEIDQLFEEEILKGRLSGRYSKENSDPLEALNDFITNAGGSVISNHRFLLTDRSAQIADRIEAAQDLQNVKRALKIIEDWIYYNLDALMAGSRHKELALLDPFPHK
jgi:hypothetical protein